MHGGAACVSLPLLEPCRFGVAGYCYLLPGGEAPAEVSAAVDVHDLLVGARQCGGMRVGGRVILKFPGRSCSARFRRCWSSGDGSPFLCRLMLLRGGIDCVRHQGEGTARENTFALFMNWGYVRTILTVGEKEAPKRRKPCVIPDNAEQEANPLRSPPVVSI